MTTDLNNVRLWKKIESFFKLLADGDSIDLAKKKAGLGPKMHRALLRDKDYYKYVSQYRKKTCGFK